MPRYETRAVLADAYKGKRAKEAAGLTHVLDTKAGATLCGRVLTDHLADVHASDEEARATCPRCDKLDPRNPSGPDDGPRALKHIFQF